MARDLDPDAFPYLSGLQRDGHILVGTHVLDPLGPPPARRPHGRLPFACPADRTLTALDIETTGLSGAASMAFLVGVGELTEDGVVVTQFLAPDLPWEEDLLSALGTFLSTGGPRLLITFNGDTFDLPFLRSRARFCRVPLSLPSSYDVLSAARRLYRGMFDSLRLTALEAGRLHHVRSDDLPGALVPATYYAALRAEDLTPLEPVLKHNALDLVATLGLLGTLAEDLEVPPRHASPALLLGRARVHAAAGDPMREAESLRELLALDPAWGLRAIALRRLDRLYRAAGETEARHRLWTEEASREDCPPEPLVAYAKILEHEIHDLAEAYAVTTEALIRARARARLVGRGHVRSALEEDLERRLARLERRLRARTPA